MVEPRLVQDPSIVAMRQALLAILGEVLPNDGAAIPLFRDIHPGETEAPTDYPAASVSLGFFVKGDEQTGGLVEYGWRWTLRLYFDLTAPDAYSLYEVALVRTLRKFQANPSLNSTCYRHDLEDSGPAVPIPGRGVLIKTFEVVAEVEEDENV